MVYDAERVYGAEIESLKASLLLAVDESLDNLCLLDQERSDDAVDGPSSSKSV